jgi:hypothetical protein
MQKIENNFLEKTQIFLYKHEKKITRVALIVATVAAVMLCMGITACFVAATTAALPLVAVGAGVLIVSTLTVLCISLVCRKLDEKSHQLVNELQKIRQTEIDQMHTQIASHRENINKLRFQCDQLNEKMQKTEEESAQLKHPLELPDEEEENWITIEIPAQSDHVQEGFNIVSQVIQGRSPEKSRESVGNFVWFCMYLLEQKKSAFIEGTIVIEDADGYIFNFLNTENAHCPAVARMSSHFVRHSNSYDHKEIQNLGGMLPNTNHKTLLFGQIELQGKKYLFLKPEKNSTQWSELSLHGLEYVEAQYNKRFHHGFDDKEHFRKERIPHDVKVYFEKIVKDTKIIKEASWQGISYMKKYLDENAILYDSGVFQKHGDHLDIRIGREGILVKADLKQPTMLQKNK